MKKNLVASGKTIEQHIYLIRGQKVIIDKDLAQLYGVETRSINQAIVRNMERFPEDFAFQLNKDEWKNLRSQSVMSSWGGHRYPPMAFTEQGVAMLSGVLRSKQAIAVNIEIMRAFVKMRYIMTSQKELTKELAQLKSFLLKHTSSSDREFRRIWQAIDKLSNPPSQEKDRIGFKLN